MSLLVEAYGSKFQPERQSIHHTFGVGDKFAGEWEPSWYTGIASAPWNGIRSAWYETKSSLQVGLGELPIDDDWKTRLTSGQRITANKLLNMLRIRNCRQQQPRWSMAFPKISRRLPVLRL